MFNKIYNLYIQQNIWIKLVICIYSFAFVYLFKENLIFSASLDSLAFRSVDDQLFQNYLREIHKNLKIYGLNNFAYGWIFWFPMAFISYPAYLLSIYGINDSLLLSLPRQISLLFMFGTSYVLYKIACKYSRDKFLIAIILLLYLFYPATGYFSLQFSTVAQNTFFSALAVYLAIISEKDNTNSIYMVAISFALAMATKFSAILLSPLIFLILVDKFSWQIDKKSILVGLKFSAIFLIIFIYSAQLNYPILLKHIKMSHFPLEAASRINLLLHNIATVTLAPIVFLILLFGLLLKTYFARKKQENNYLHFIYINFTIVLAALYLVYTIKLGATYISFYFAVLSFLLPLGILCLEYFNIKIKFILGLLLLILNTFLNVQNIFPGISQWQKISWNIYYNKQFEQNTQDKISAQKVVQEFFRGCTIPIHNLSIIRDLDSFSIYSPLRPDMHIHEQLVLTDWPYDILRIDPKQTWDIIGFDKRTNFFLGNNLFDDFIANLAPDVAVWYRINHNFIFDFLKNPSINGQTYQILFENHSFIYFVKRQLLERSNLPFLDYRHEELLSNGVSMIS